MKYSRYTWLSESPADHVLNYRMIIILHKQFLKSILNQSAVKEKLDFVPSYLEKIVYFLQISLLWPFPPLPLKPLCSLSAPSVPVTHTPAHLSAERHARLDPPSSSNQHPYARLYHMQFALLGILLISMKLCSSHCNHWTSSLKLIYSNFYMLYFSSLAYLQHIWFTHPLMMVVTSYGSSNIETDQVKLAYTDFNYINRKLNVLCSPCI